MQLGSMHENCGAKEVKEIMNEDEACVQSNANDITEAYVKPNFFYKNSSVHTTLEISLLISFPLLSMMIVADNISADSTYSSIMDIFIQVIIGFIISYIFYYLNIAKEKMRIDNDSLYLLTVLYVYLKKIRHHMQDDIERVSKTSERFKNRSDDPGDIVLAMEIMTINTHIYRMKNYIESLLFSLGNILPSSNFTLSLFFSDIKLELKELDNLKVRDKCMINFIQIRYSKYIKLIDRIIRLIEGFISEFSDAVMVKQRIKINCDLLNYKYHSKLQTKAGDSSCSPGLE